MKCLSFHLKPEDCDFAEALMFEFSATAVTFEDAHDVPLLEPLPGEIKLWPESILTAWFDEDTDVTALKNAIVLNFPTADCIESIVESQDWQKNMHDQFKPILFSNKLCICPSWEARPDTDIAVLDLDPGLAFGTGSHPTTAMCLNWLAQHLKPGQTVLDYGCGSGILGLAAIKLGAKKVWAVDYDPQALQSTLANAKKNHIGPEQLCALDIKSLNLIPKVDIIVANILAQPLIDLASQFKQYAKETTILVLSGILDSQADAVASAYADWSPITERQQEADWMCLIANHYPEQ